MGGIIATWILPSRLARCAVAVVASAGVSASPMIGGLPDTSARFGTADQCLLVDRVRERAVQLFGGGLVGNEIDQWMPHCGQPTAHALATLQQRQPFRSGQRVDVQRSRPVQRIKRSCDRFPVNNRTDLIVAKLMERTDRKYP